MYNCKSYYILTCHSVTSLHTLSKLYDVPFGFVPPPPPLTPSFAIVLLHFWLLKGGCYSILDNLSCSCLHKIHTLVIFLNLWTVLYMSMLLWMHETLFNVLQCVCTHNGYKWIRMIRDQVNTRPSEFALLACYYTVRYTIPTHLCPISVPFHWVNVCPNSAVEILKSFVRHRSDRILDFVGPNKILSDQTFV